MNLRVRLFLELAMYHYESDEKIKAEKEPILFNETLPYYLERLDNIAQKNNGHLAAGKVSIYKF